MVCTRCGKEIKGKPVMVVYGDPSFENKTQVPFAVDRKCFTDNEKITVAEWRTKRGESELVEFEITRYVEQ